MIAEGGGMTCDADHWHSGCRILGLISQYVEVHGQFFLCYTQLMIIVGLCLDSGNNISITTRLHPKIHLNHQTFGIMTSVLKSNCLVSSLIWICGSMASGSQTTRSTLT